MISDQIEEFVDTFRNGLNFEGHASRSEFWSFLVALLLLQTILRNASAWMSGHLSLHFGVYVGVTTNMPWLVLIATGVLIIPFVALFARRMQDVSIAPKWAFIISLVLVWLRVVVVKAYPTLEVAKMTGLSITVCLAILALAVGLWPSTAGPNRFGPNPHEVPS